MSGSAEAASAATGGRWMGTPALLIDHGPLRRGGRLVLEASRLELPLPAGVGVAGVNGSGKSSLFMALAGVLQGAQSRLAAADGTQPRLALVTQEAALPEWLDAAGTARLYGTELDVLAERYPGLYLDELAGRRVAALSSGQRQALALALALACATDLVLLDEPFAALDFRRRAGALDAVRGWREAGASRAFLVSSQVASDLTALCDHFIVLRRGRVVFSGPRARLGGDDRIVERGLLALLA
jgi:zinc/manganese transport system ATP-binding protein